MEANSALSQRKSKRRHENIDHKLLNVMNFPEEHAK
jgi:hypothetical protein